MVSKVSRPESEIIQRIRAVEAANAKSFRDLLQAGGFDLASDLRYQNFSGLSFTGEDLRGIDFTGANLVGCDFSNALIVGARFERARLGMVIKAGVQYAAIEVARDWVDFAMSWKTAPRESTLQDCGDDHLPVGAIFHDAPFLPRMVVIPQLSTSDRHGAVRVAVSFDVVSATEFDFHKFSERPNSDLMRIELKRQYTDQRTYNRPTENAVETDGAKFALWSSLSVGLRYRPLFQPESDKDGDLAFFRKRSDNFDCRAAGYYQDRAFGGFTLNGSKLFEQFAEAKFPLFVDDWPLEDEIESDELMPVKFRMVRELAPGRMMRR